MGDAYRSFLHVHAASSRKDREQITPFLLLDQAAWHSANALKVPSNISFLQLPPWRKRLSRYRSIT
jgi:hypothetical protein